MGSATISRCAPCSSRSRSVRPWRRSAAETRHTLDRVERLERDLHIDIIHRCRNEQLRETIRRSQLVIVAIHHAFDLYRDSAVISMMVAEHVAILGHVLAGRREKAMKAMEAHLTRSLAENIVIIRSLGPLPEARRPPYLVQVAG